MSIGERVKNYLFWRKLQKAAAKSLPVLADIIQPPLKPPPIYMEFIEEEEDENIKSEFKIKEKTDAKIYRTKRHKRKG